MNETRTNLDLTKVIRTVYLEVDQDERLRELASHLKITKGELIRKLLREGIDKHNAEIVDKSNTL